MAGNILRRFLRTPLNAICVFLLATILSYILSSLHYANEAELENYEQTYHTIPVEMRITNLSATKSDDLELPGWMADLFRQGGKIEPSFASYAKDLQIKSSHLIHSIDGMRMGIAMTGLTSIEMESALLPENGTVINWNQGFDETVLATDAAVCLVPENLQTDTGTMQIKFVYEENAYGVEMPITHEYEVYVKIAGTYTNGDRTVIYCPYLLIEQVYAKLQEDRVIDSVSATLNDNNLLEELYADRYIWFAEPNPRGSKTEWGYADYDYYPYALDIDDSLLVRTTQMLEDSIAVNELCAALVVMLSAGAGFLIGFLMIRSRKREINLMRTLGSSNGGIYLDFCLEQMVCIVLGTLVGGAMFGFNAPQKLLMFDAVYFVGLTTALLIFLNKNLLTTIKEDE